MQGAASSLVFAAGQRYAFINITLINNDIPEPDKTFSVQLANPRAGAAVGPGSRAVVTIDASDGAYGIYQFADSALNTSAKETGDAGFNTVMIEVLLTFNDFYNFYNQLNYYLTSYGGHSLKYLLNVLSWSYPQISAEL